MSAVEPGVIGVGPGVSAVEPGVVAVEPYAQICMKKIPI